MYTQKRKKQPIKQQPNVSSIGLVALTTTTKQVFYIKKKKQFPQFVKVIRNIFIIRFNYNLKPKVLYKFLRSNKKNIYNIGTMSIYSWTVFEFTFYFVNNIPSEFYMNIS